MEKTITKDILKNKLYSGQQPAMELLYSRYSAMLFSYILQFVPDKAEAEYLLIDIFSRLTPKLQQACDSSLSIYCWLQVEARKIILEYNRSQGSEGMSVLEPMHVVDGRSKVNYFSLLQDASPEHQWVFRELFINGREKEELARQAGMDLAYIGRLLKESLLIIREKLG